MVSLDSTSRVMVLPVTRKQVSKGQIKVAVRQKPLKRGSLTSLDEDLHVERYSMRCDLMSSRFDEAFDRKTR